MKWLTPFIEFFHDLSFVEGVLIILVILFYRGTVKSHEGRLNDRQLEIDRLAKDNREYRERFAQFVDRELKLNSDHNRQ